MKGHPGGLKITETLLDLSGLEPPGQILDIGAGTGAALGFLGEKGFEAWGIDREPRAEGVICADMRALPYPDEFFDAVLAECSIYISGTVEASLAEAHRVLKPGGLLLMSDIIFDNSIKPWIDAVSKTGYSVISLQDLSEEWSRYVTRCIWEGNLVSYPAIEASENKPSGYFLMVCRREFSHEIIR